MILSRFSIAKPPQSLLHLDCHMIPKGDLSLAEIDLKIENETKIVDGTDWIFLWNGSFFIMILSFALVNIVFTGALSKLIHTKDKLPNCTFAIYIWSTWVWLCPVLRWWGPACCTSQAPGWERLPLYKRKIRLMGSENTFSLETSSSSHIWICLPENPLEVLLINTLVTIVSIDNGVLGWASH